MKTYSSLVTIISDGENNFMQNKCNMWVKYWSVLHNHKCQYMGSSAIHLHPWYRHDRYANSKFIITAYFNVAERIISIISKWLSRQCGGLVFQRSRDRITLLISSAYFNVQVRSTSLLNKNKTYVISFTQSVVANVVIQIN